MDTAIQDKIDNFISTKKIPHILLHGESNSKCIKCLQYLLHNIYDSPQQRKDYILYVNCAHGKGIKFIREQLKFFAKTNINDVFNGTQTTNSNHSIIMFKSIVLLNADFLTIDAQSALRRCIELYSHKTRFFMVVLDKDAIINPILSRFCTIYIANNAHKTIANNIRTSNLRYLKKILTHIDVETQTYLGQSLFMLSQEIYNRGIYYVDFIDCIDKLVKDPVIKYGMITYINKIRHEIKHEELLIACILNIYCLRHKLELENIYPF